MTEITERAPHRTREQDKRAKTKQGKDGERGREREGEEARKDSEQV